MMDPLEQRLLEEIEFWQLQIEIAEKQRDQSVLPRLHDALELVRFRLQRYKDCRRNEP